MNLTIICEDSATKEILLRVINFCSLSYEKLSQTELRGGKIKNNFQKYNLLAKNELIILLLDLDTADCPSTLLKTLLQRNVKNENFLVNIAVDEAESWLIADRENFSQYFEVPIEKIPFAEKNIFQKGIEMLFPYKSSLYIIREIIPHSKNKEFVRQLFPKNGAKKGPEYNKALTPFIQNIWDINNAMKNSESLHGMIHRIEKWESKNTIL